ncbi:hypothetical protein J2Z79_002190 [Symbiobacterium terraclitae]|uniref:Lycopene cyclase domain-containing protein n=1 Tax=Symbiobacterium terraclitae TaxID=557451 RepID=A0ABS4JTB5_9FIRM|nr:hypothetical protein [Symbiobacterium terraclitae]MBP2018775.1 hypothetical protein [Symbiobacterium terraclitae]
MRDEIGLNLLREAGVLFHGRRGLALLVPLAVVLLRFAGFDATSPGHAAALELLLPLAGPAIAVVLLGLDRHGMGEVLLVGSPAGHRVWMHRHAWAGLWLALTAVLPAPSLDLLLVLGPAVLLMGLVLSLSRRVNLRAGLSAALVWWGISCLAIRLADPILYFGPFSWAMLQLVETGLAPEEIWLRKGVQLLLGLLLALDWARQNTRGVHR